MGHVYRVGEFAALTGVSVRALHHYDRVGLLEPLRSEAGYRLYTTSDLWRVQQIATLRYLGFSLAAIGEILSRPTFDLEASLSIQAQVIRERIQALERVGDALGALLTQYRRTARWDWELAARAAAAAGAGLAQKEETMKDYYTEQELAERMRETGAAIPREEIQAVEQAWPALLAEIRAHRDLDPASEEARELADRWQALTERTTYYFQHDPRIGATIAEGYRQNRYGHIEGTPTPEDFAFIQRVKAAREAQA